MGNNIKISHLVGAEQNQMQHDKAFTL